MPRTLYLHIGAHRTATSSLQSFLHANAGRLPGKGFFYPFGVRRHVRLMNRLFFGERTIADSARQINVLADGKEHEIHSVILSDEDICTRPDLSLLTEYRQYFDVKVVYCLRRQDLWLESWYLQNVKWQWNADLAHLTFDAFLRRRRDFFWIDYNTYIHRLEETFGAENVLVYVFENEQMPDGPVAAFCDLVGLTERAGFSPPSHKNSSNSPLVSEFMRCLPLDEAPPKYRARLERACSELNRDFTGSESQAAPLLLAHAQRKQILGEYARGNRALAMRRFGGEALFQAPLPPVNAPVDHLALPQDSYALMEQVVAPFMRHLIALNTEDGGEPA